MICLSWFTLCDQASLVFTWFSWLASQADRLSSTPNPFKTSKLDHHELEEQLRPPNQLWLFFPPLSSVTRTITEPHFSAVLQAGLFFESFHIHLKFLIELSLCLSTCVSHLSSLSLHYTLLKFFLLFFVLFFILQPLVL